MTASVELAGAANATHGFYRACVEACVCKGPVAETRTDGRGRHGGRREQSKSRKANLRSHQLMANDCVAAIGQVLEVLDYVLRPVASPHSAILNKPWML